MRTPYFESSLHIEYHVGFALITGIHIRIERCDSLDQNTTGICIDAREIDEKDGYCKEHRSADKTKNRTSQIIWNLDFGH